MRTRRSATVLMAVALAIGVVGPVSGATPAMDASRLTDLVARASDPGAAFAALTRSEQKAVLDYTSLSYVTAWKSPVVQVSGPTGIQQSVAAIKCYTWTWGRDAHNPIGALLWQFTQKIEWCANGTKITNNPFRTVKGIPKFLWWSYNGLVADTVGGGKNEATYRSFVEGWFSYRPPMPGLNQDNYPWLDMTAHANGAGTGSGGG